MTNKLKNHYGLFDKIENIEKTSTRIVAGIIQIMKALREIKTLDESGELVAWNLNTPELARINKIFKPLSGLTVELEAELQKILPEVLLDALEADREAVEGRQADGYCG